MKKISLSDVANKIKTNDNFVIISHRAPDGDTLGSALALYIAIRRLGKKADFICNDLIPYRYHYMFDGLEYFLKKRTYDLDEIKNKYIISVDIADKHLFGDKLRELADYVDICIDHHESFGEFGEFAYRDPNSASSAEIIYKLLKELGTNITPQIANLLYTGVCTDTGCFKYSNTTPSTFRIAADLVELGADAPEINRIHFDTITHGRIALEKLALDTLEYFYDNRCVVMYISREMMDKSGAMSDDVEGLVPIPRQIEGSVVGVTVRERKEGGFKVSIRSYPPLNSADICNAFGGGGHSGAGGCVFDDEEYTVVRDKLVEEIGRRFAEADSMNK